jgi:hypothetical protein
MGRQQDENTEAFPGFDLVVIILLLYNFDVLVSLPNRASFDLPHNRSGKAYLLGAFRI